MEMPSSPQPPQYQQFSSTSSPPNTSDDHDEEDPTVLDTSSVPTLRPPRIKSRPPTYYELEQEQRSASSSAFPVPHRIVSSRRSASAAVGHGHSRGGSGDLNQAAALLVSTQMRAEEKMRRIKISTPPSSLERRTHSRSSKSLINKGKEKEACGLEWDEGDPDVDPDRTIRVNNKRRSGSFASLIEVAQERRDGGPGDELLFRGRKGRSIGRGFGLGGQDDSIAGGEETDEDEDIPALPYEDDYQQYEDDDEGTTTLSADNISHSPDQDDQNLSALLPPLPSMSDFNLDTILSDPSNPPSPVDHLLHLSISLLSLSRSILLSTLSLRSQLDHLNTLFLQSSSRRITHLEASIKSTLSHSTQIGEMINQVDEGVKELVRKKHREALGFAPTTQAPTKLMGVGDRRNLMIERPKTVYVNAEGGFDVDMAGPLPSTSSPVSTSIPKTPSRSNSVSNDSTTTTTTTTTTHHQSTPSSSFFKFPKVGTGIRISTTTSSSATSKDNGDTSETASSSTVDSTPSSPTIGKFLTPFSNLGGLFGGGVGSSPSTPSPSGPASADGTRSSLPFSSPRGHTKRPNSYGGRQDSVSMPSTPPNESRRRSATAWSTVSSPTHATPRENSSRKRQTSFTSNASSARSSRSSSFVSDFSDLPPLPESTMVHNGKQQQDGGISVTPKPSQRSHHRQTPSVSSLGAKHRLHHHLSHHARTPSAASQLWGDLEPPPGSPAIPKASDLLKGVKRREEEIKEKKVKMERDEIEKEEREKELRRARSVSEAGLRHGGTGGGSITTGFFNSWMIGDAKNDEERNKTTGVPAPGTLSRSTSASANLQEAQVVAERDNTTNSDDGNNNSGTTQPITISNSNSSATFASSPSDSFSSSSSIKSSEPTPSTTIPILSTGVEFSGKGLSSSLPVDKSAGDHDGFGGSNRPMGKLVAKWSGKEGMLRADRW